ncbi:MAG: AraC family transcriptional regulator, partial [Lachnospiraceae bacterium]|nr:AraC family transcriptional regulator [Lachnospiraceae bacterium]
IRQIVQMTGTDKISGALKMVELFIGEMKRDRHSGHVLEKSVDMFVEEMLRTYQNVLQGEEKELLRFQNIYQFANIDELMEELTGWMIGFHEKIDTEFDDYKNKSKMKQALAYIEENYDKDLNMAVISNYVSMNYSLFSYAFKQYTGKNFVNYLKALRVNEAKRLLEETDMRVIEISQKVGYENEKHFMKLFKSQCGVSPTEYRKNMQFRER